MTTNGDGGVQDRSSSFREAAGKASPGILRELLDFLRQNKKWWLTPILLLLLLVTLLVVFGGSAPFIYTLF